MQYKIVVDKQSRTNPSAEKREYIVDIEELRQKGDVKDSLIIEGNRTYVTRKLSLSKYGVLSVLGTPKTEEVNDIDVKLFEGDNYIYLVDMVGNKFYAEYVIKNEITDGFPTKVEMNTAISQTANQIELNVNQKLTEYSTTEEMNAAINVKANEITSTVSATYSTKEDTASAISSAKTEIKQTTDSISTEVSKKVGNNEVISKINQSAETVGINADKIELSADDVLNLLSGNTINLSGKNIQIASNNFNVDKDGNMTCTNANISGTIESNNANITGGQITLLGTNGGNGTLNIGNLSRTEDTYIASDGIYTNSSNGNRAYLYANNNEVSMYMTQGSSDTRVKATGITTPSLVQTSLSSAKKNFEKLENALDIIKNTDIYKYNLKLQKDDDKKHIGFVIGDDYKYSSDITATNEKGEEIGADLYSMVSVVYKAIQEQQEIIESLTTRIEKLEEDKNG